LAATATRPASCSRPGVEDCFYTAIEAVNIARKYNVPVFVLSDQAIATRIEAFDRAEPGEGLPGHFPRPHAVAEYKPTTWTPHGVTPRVVPGTRILSGRYPVATGLEHDELGHPTAPRSCTWK
jgi:2-oxoglutarate ferredoxin oxidoreductase subunit alpha